MLRNSRVALLCAFPVLCLVGELAFAQGKTGRTGEELPVRRTETTQQKTAQKTQQKTLPESETGTRAAQKVAPPEGQKARPTGAPYRIEKTAAETQTEEVDPALEKILKDWELKSAEIETLSCEFRKFRYNHKWQVEYRSQGKMMYRSPDHGMYELAALKITSDLVGRSTDARGNKLKEPYQLKGDNSERWYCDGAAITKIDDIAKTYQQHPIPDDMRGQKIVEGPLPFVFGMKAAAAKARYWIKLYKHDLRTHQIRLDVYPKTKMDAANYQKATLLLDDQLFTPIAVKLLDPTGNEEIVHTFQNMKVNSVFPGISIRDPFKPSLSGLKPVVQESVAKDGKTPATPQRTAQTPSDAAPKTKGQPTPQRKTAIVPGNGKG